MISISASNGVPRSYNALALTPQACAAWDEWYDAGAQHDLIWPGEYARNLAPFPTLQQPQVVRPRAGCLHWPVVSAARYATGVFVLDSYSLGQLRIDLAGGSACTLSFTDDPTGTDTPRSFPMFLIAARPVSRQTDSTGQPFPSTPVAPAPDDGYLLLFVDARYYWLQQPLSTDSLAVTPSTYDDLLDQLANEVGETITVDPVPNTYGSPSSRWIGGIAGGMSVAHLLDAAAGFVGARIVYTPDGLFAQQPSDALRAAALAYNTGLLSRLSAGGPVEETESIVSMPVEALCTFYDPDIANCPPQPMQAIGGTGGRGPGTVTAWLDIPAGDSGQMQKAATQWAASWGSWQIPAIDARYTGFVSFPANGFLGYVDYEHQADVGYTQIQPMPIGWGALVGFGMPCGDNGDCCAPEIGTNSSTSGGNSGQQQIVFDGADEEATYDVFCDDGSLIVVRGQLGIAVDTSAFPRARLRMYWYNLTETQEGCCDCGPAGQSSSGGTSGSGTNMCTFSCPQCPQGTSYQWVANVQFQTGWTGSQILQCAGTITQGTKILTYNPRPNYPCRWTLTEPNSKGFATWVLEYQPGFGNILLPSWNFFVLQTYTTGSTVPLLQWTLPASQWNCLGPNAMPGLPSICSIPEGIPPFTAVLTPLTTTCGGGGGGGGGGTIATGCCPGRLLPTPLYCTFSGGTGELACLNGYEVPINSTGMTNPDWRAMNASFTLPPGCIADANINAFDRSVDVSCLPGQTVFTGDIGFIGGIATAQHPTVFSCGPPFLAVFHLTISNPPGCALCGDQITLVITEVP